MMPRNGLRLKNVWLGIVVRKNTQNGDLKNALKKYPRGQFSVVRLNPRGSSCSGDEANKIEKPWREFCGSEQNVRWR